MTGPEIPPLDELAAGPLDATDDRILDALAELYTTVDPVPDGLVDRIRFGITLDALHAEVAELQRGGDLAGVRSDDVTTTRTVTFTSARLSIVVTMTALSTERARIDGWITGGAQAAVELRVVDGVTATTADEDGRFALESVTRGLAQFTVRPADGGVVITPSIEL